MKWAVYWEKDDEINCVFHATEREARTKIADLVDECEQASADAERNLDYAITLLEVKGEVRQGPDGLTLKERR